MLFDCFISWLYMRVLKLTFGKNIFLHIFLKFQIFKCEVFGRTYSYVQTSAVLRLASLFLPYTHLCIFIDLSWHVVCFSLGFLPRLWHSLHNCSHSMIYIVSSVILVSLCAFRILEYLFIGIFFVHENPVCVLGWYWYIWVIWIAIFVCVILGHPIDSCHNTTFFMGLTRSNISLWCYFWKYLCLNLFRNMLSSSS